MLVVMARRSGVTVGDLSPRELEVADLLARGRTPKEIAGRLSLSLHTVRHYADGARVKLGARTIPELTALLARSRARNGA